LERLEESRPRRIDMRMKKGMALLVAAGLALMMTACFPSYGYRRFPGTPRFAPNDYGQIRLLRQEPGREHIRLGEVWIRPDPWMDRYEVEGILREKTARLGGDALVIVADRYLRGATVRGYWRARRTIHNRQIVGIAIRYRR
jgi:hypothetical protein